MFCPLTCSLHALTSAKTLCEEQVFLSYKEQFLGTITETLDEGAGLNVEVRADRTFWNKGQKQEILLGIFLR